MKFCDRKSLIPVSILILSFVFFGMNSTSSSSSDGDEYVLEAIYEFYLLLARAALATALSVIEALGDQESDYSVYPDRPKIDRLGSLLASHESIFRMNVVF